MKKVIKNIEKTLLAVTLLYVSVYVWLSFKGRYEPSVVGLNGVKVYSWAPMVYYDSDHPWAGSVDAIRSNASVYGGWNNPLLWKFFYPLYYVDISFIHKNK
ncbi:MAG: hypothetical protein JWR69_4670 [Pedosphaera sp.]|nr:hypothetical protein [Pedosphaera sp.]